MRKDQEKKINWEEKSCNYAPTAKNLLEVLNICPTDLMVQQIMLQLQDFLQSRSNITLPFA